MAITDGNRATVFMDAKYEYPLTCGFGEVKTYGLSETNKRSMAAYLTKCGATHGGSWDKEFTYKYYVQGNTWLCRR